MFENQELVVQSVRSGFNGRHVLVVGDLILDRYMWGHVNRISPEAPVPVVHLDRQTYAGGGAANVALNLAGLGLAVDVAGFTGSDEGSRLLVDSLTGGGVNTDGIVRLDDRPTITKTRIIGDHQQMLRIDDEVTTPIDHKSQDALLANFNQRLESRPAIVVLSDYAKGALSPNITKKIIKSARKMGVPVLVDPKGTDFSKYAGATAISPNRQELALVCDTDQSDLPVLLDAGESMRRKLGLDFMVVTLSAEGMAVMDANMQRRIPTMAKEVSDVSGAGDTVIATLAAGLASGLSRLDAAHLANLAGGIVVSKVGTAPVYRDELLAELDKESALDQHSKIASVEEIAARVAEWRSRGLEVVFTNGCFDLLHAGHVSYLESAKAIGDRLVVGLNTDRSVRELKGPSRPIMEEQDRAHVLSGLASIDAVTFFDDETPLALINTIKPNVLVKGADYTEDEVVGAKEVKSWGGRVVLMPLVAGKSTTRIIEGMNRGKPIT